MLSKIEAAVEAILFASGDTVQISKIAAVLDAEPDEVKRIAQGIADKLDEFGSGTEFLLLGDELQLATRQEFSQYVTETLDVLRNVPLSTAALETLAVISYNQPVSKGYIEQVRGVDSSGIVNNLVIKGLVEEAGRLDIPGKPIGYRVTANFLRAFSLTSLKDLPPLSEDDKTPLEKLAEQKEEEGT